MARDLTMQVVKLLSQYIVSNKEKITEGPVFQKTSCMNPEDAEIIGIIEAVKVFLDQPGNEELVKDLSKIQDFYEILGISRWNKGELTHLGFRAGTRYEEKVDVAKDNESEAESILDQIDEADTII